MKKEIKEIKITITENGYILQTKVEIGAYKTIEDVMEKIKLIEGEQDAAKG
jgi:hypothetical protein